MFSAILFACVCGGGLFLGVDGLLMSLAIVKDMGFDDKVKDNEGAGDDDVSRVDAGKTGADHEESADEGGGTLSRYRSESSIAATEDEEEDEERKIELGPQCTLKEQLEKDKVAFAFFLFFLFICSSEKSLNFSTTLICVCSGFRLRWYRMMRA